MAVLCFIGDQISRAFVIIEPVKNVRYKGYCMKVIPLPSITPYTKDTEINLRELINTIPDLIWLKDKDGIFLSCNTMFERYIGSKEADIVGKTDYDFVSKELADIFRKYDQKIMTANHTFVTEENVTFADDGHQAIMETIKTPQYDIDGNIIGVLGVARDITKRKKAEDLLNKFSLAVEQNPCAIFITDLNAEIEYANAAFSRTTGYSLEEILGLNPRFLNCGKTPKETYKELWQTIKNGETWKGELINRRKDGSEYIEFASITPVRGQDEKISHYLAIKEDITARKQFEIEQRIAAIAFESQDGIMITDANNIIIRVNKAFTKITGYESEEMIGRTPSFLKSGKQSPEFYQKMWAKLLTEGSWQGEILNRNKNDQISPEWLTITAVKDDYEKTMHYVASIVDITDYKIAEEKIIKFAFYDQLTGLANRRKLMDNLNRSIAMCNRENKQFAVLMIDLDRFKAINDTLGHLAGDELLKQVATRISLCLRDTDTLARMGGDEFIILLEGISRQEDAARVATEIVEDLSAPFKLTQSDAVCIGASIGIAIYPQHGTTSELLLNNSDTALYQAKDNGRGCFSYFPEDLTIPVPQYLKSEARLRYGIENGELRVFYQAQIDVKTNEIIGAEALVRWLDPNEGLILPNTFIPLAEEAGLITKIGEWVLREVCRQGKEWIDAGFTPIRLAVNVSSLQFEQDNILSSIETILKETDYPAEYLELELTESSLMENHELVVDILTHLRALGIHLAIDDFGTGYSSLAYLKRFPLDVLKIDKSFIDDISHNTDDMAITEAIISMGQTLGFKVLAEGVETIEQLNFLKLKQCDIFQGYIHSKPIPSDEFVKLLHYKVVTD